MPHCWHLFYLCFYSGLTPVLVIGRQAVKGFLLIDELESVGKLLSLVYLKFVLWYSIPAFQYAIELNEKLKKAKIS